MSDYLSPLQAIHKDGTVVLFDDVHDLSRHVHWLSRQGNIGEHHSIQDIDGNGIRVALCAATWVLRDDAGRPVDLALLNKLRYEASRGLRLPSWPKGVAAEAAARGLPIPHTGKRHYVCCSMRAPRTNQEIRANTALASDRNELPVLVEQIRARKDLPTAWDDIMRHREKGWKRHRRHQWRAGAAA